MTDQEIANTLIEAMEALYTAESARYRPDSSRSVRRTALGRMETARWIINLTKSAPTLEWLIEQFETIIQSLEQKEAHAPNKKRAMMARVDKMCYKKALSLIKSRCGSSGKAH
jgi:hypothetical protein